MVRSNIISAGATFLASGTGQVLYADVVALPGAGATFDPALTLVGFCNLFVPTTPGDWSPAPNSFQIALDQLAARVTALGG